VLASVATVAVGQDELAAAAGEAAAEVDWLRWDESPAGFLMTKDEIKDWRKVTTEAEARDFVELFWAKRNPDPAQPFNPFKAQFESRVRYADENFSYEGRRGALTDRGRVLVVMGPPHMAENRAPTETVERMDDQAFGSDEVRGNAVLWMYDPARLPEEMKIKGTRMLYVFYEERLGTNNYVLDRSHREATLGVRALSKAPEAYVLHPKLTTVPKPVAVPDARAANPAHLDWLAVPSPPLNEQAIILAEPGLADADHRPWWLHIELPGDAPKLDLLAGRVKDASGEVLSTFEKPVTPVEFKGYSIYHLTFPLEAGDYRIEVAGASGGEPQLVYAEDVTIPEAPEGTWLSDIIVGLHAEEKEDAMLGSAYCLGRLHVLPMTGTEVTRADEVSYFGYFVRPTEVSEGRAPLASKAQLKRDGRRFGRPLEMPVQAVQVSDQVYVYANSLNLAALPETGEYTLTFTVTDPATETSVEREVTINVTE
jgi:GWxTD domain-containing protein